MISKDVKEVNKNKRKLFISFLILVFKFFFLAFVGIVVRRKLKFWRNLEKFDSFLVILNKRINLNQNCENTWL